MKAKINDGCIGCGQCSDICPEVFKLNDDGIAEVIAAVTPGSLASAKEAADSCPVGIIEVEE